MLLWLARWQGVSQEELTISLTASCNLVSASCQDFLSDRNWRKWQLHVPRKYSKTRTGSIALDKYQPGSVISRHSIR